MRLVSAHSRFVIPTRIACTLVLLLVLPGCSSDSERSEDPGEFESFGNFQAIVNGEQIEFSAARARQYSSPYLQIVGRNCAKRMMVGFDIPFAEGTYDLDSLGQVFVFVRSARACPETNGGSSPQITLEAEVVVRSLSASRVSGSFRIVAGRDVGYEEYIITNGAFDVERE